jgi:hypothetical protein
MDIVRILCTLDVNGKTILFETIARIEGGEDEGEWWRGVNSSMIYLIHCKNFCKCHNIPSSTIKKRKENANSKL